MKKMMTMITLLLLVSSLCFAGSLTGYVTDAKCAKAGKFGAEHAKCAAGCLKGGQPAVLVTEDGKVYEVADAAKLADHHGHKVEVMGKVEGTKIASIDSVKHLGG